MSVLRCPPEAIHLVNAITLEADKPSGYRTSRGPVAALRPQSYLLLLLLLALGLLAFGSTLFLLLAFFLRRLRWGTGKRCLERRPPRTCFRDDV